MQGFITDFGYLALFVGSFLEGESFLIAAAFLAKRGYFNLYLVMLVALAGAYLGDVVLYYLGRHKGAGIISKFPQARAYYPKAKKLFDRFGIWAIFITRYLYGLRFAAAAFLGLMRMKRAEFLPFAFLSCAVWAVAMGGLGYVFGASLEALIGEIKHYEKVIGVAIVILGLGAWVFRRMWNNRKAKCTTNGNGQKES
ncbi:MAG: DedA family protein [Candidatus Zixiibacteriota bacterium]